MFTNGEKHNTNFSEYNGWHTHANKYEYSLDISIENGYEYIPKKEIICVFSYWFFSGFSLSRIAIEISIAVLLLIEMCLNVIRLAHIWCESESSPAEENASYGDCFIYIRCWWRILIDRRMQEHSHPKYAIYWHNIENDNGNDNDNKIKIAPLYWVVGWMCMDILFILYILYSVLCTI